MILKTTIAKIFFGTVFSIGVLLTGCGTPIDQTESVLAGGDAAAGVTTLLANVAGTLQNTFLTAYRSGEYKPNLIFNLLNQLFNFAQATVTSCTASVFSDTCASGAKIGSYTGCYVGTTARTFSGTVTLNYSDSTCAFTAAGQTVTRQSETIRYVNAYDTFTTRTGARTDYRGTSIGGGTQLIKTAGGYELNILGFNKFYTAQTGAVSRDVSVKSTANITVTDPTAAAITFTGGSLEVVDSVSLFVATYVPTSVVVNYSTCCYPTSGTMAVTYTTGTMTGSATVEFYSSSCGAAILSSGTETATVPLWGCQ